MKVNIQVGQRVKTPSGLLGTVISSFETNYNIVCEVEFDCGGLMHYCSGALIQIMDGRCETDRSNDLDFMNDYTYEQFSKDCDRW